MVEQAKGILAVMFAITPDEALILMQAFAGQEFPPSPTWPRTSSRSPRSRPASTSTSYASG